MSIPIIVPEIGESITDATIIEWRKAEGDFVQVGDILLELETEKVNLEVGSDHAGTLEKIVKKNGEDVTVGETIGIIGESQEAATEKKEEKKETEEKEEKEETPPQKTQKTQRPPAVTEPERVVPIPHKESEGNERVAGAVEPEPKPPSEEPEQMPSERRETRRRMSRRRQTIARRLLDAQHGAAMLTTFNEVDMGEIMALRGRVRESFERQHGIKLGIVSFFVKAATSALRNFPVLNSEIQGDEIVTKHYYDIGVAMDAEGGLVVPVLRDIGAMSIAEIEQHIRGFESKVREGKLTLDDLLGGCFTISNGGIFGSLLSTPILNPPQVGILGLHRIEERPVAIEGEVVIRPMMYLALSYDHRLVDGRQAVEFLVHIKQDIEDPLRMWVGE